MGFIIKLGKTKGYDLKSPPLNPTTVNLLTLAELIKK